MSAFLRSDTAARLGIGFLLGAIGLYVMQPAEAQENFRESVVHAISSIT